MDRNSRLWWNASRECISQKFGHWSSILPCLPVFLRSSFCVCLIKRWKKRKKNNKEEKRIRKPAHLRTEPGTPFSFANSPRISWRGRVTNAGQLMSLPPIWSFFFFSRCNYSFLSRKKKENEKDKITIVFLFPLASLSLIVASISFFCVWLFYSSPLFPICIVIIFFSIKQCSIPTTVVTGRQKDRNDLFIRRLH